MSTCTDERIAIKLSKQIETAIVEDDLDKAERLLGLYAGIAIIMYVKGETR